jgi:hypothetical protein
VSVTKKPQDSVALYQHRAIRVDHTSVRKLQEVIANVEEALKQQRPSESDD